MQGDRLEKVRVWTAIGAAVVSGGAALYGVYSKARGEARQDTAATYETLAPAVNELRRQVADLQAENSELRARSGDRAQPPGGEARAPAPRPRRRPEPAAPPATTPAPAPAPAPAPPPAAEPAPANRLPIDFDTAVGIWKEIEKRRSGQR